MQPTTTVGFQQREAGGKIAGVWESYSDIVQFTAVRLTLRSSAAAVKEING
jgi:hypothetical protein